MDNIIIEINVPEYQEYGDEHIVEETISNIMELQPTNTPSTENRRAVNRYSYLDKVVAEDIREEVELEKMFGAELCCKTFKCNVILPKDVVLDHRRTFQELSKEQQDIVIMSHLHAQRPLAALASCYKCHRDTNADLAKDKDAKHRTNMKYFFAGLPICRAMFFFVYALRKTRFDRIVKHYDQNGLVPRVHGLANKPPTRQSIVHQNDVEAVKTFLTAYGSKHVLPLPRKLSKFKNVPMVRLPSDLSKADLWKQYLKSIEERTDLRRLARTTFTRIWRDHCPYVVITRPTRVAEAPPGQKPAPADAKT